MRVCGVSEGYVTYVFAARTSSPARRTPHAASPVTPGPAEPAARYAVGVEPLVLTLPAAIFRVDNGVFEVFQVEHEGPLRVPLAWLSIRADPPKRGQVFLRVGQA